jgi:hypothetical protein
MTEALRADAGTSPGYRRHARARDTSQSELLPASARTPANPEMMARSHRCPAAPPHTFAATAHAGVLFAPARLLPSAPTAGGNGRRAFISIMSALAPPAALIIRAISNGDAVRVTRERQPAPTKASATSLSKALPSSASRSPAAREARCTRGTVSDDRGAIRRMADARW